MGEKRRCLSFRHDQSGEKSGHVNKKNETKRLIAMTGRKQKVMALAVVSNAILNFIQPIRVLDWATSLWLFARKNLCGPVGIELIWYRTRANRLINESNTTEGWQQFRRWVTVRLSFQFSFLRDVRQSMVLNLMQIELPRIFYLDAFPCELRFVHFL